MQSSSQERERTGRRRRHGARHCHDHIIYPLSRDDPWAGSRERRARSRSLRRDKKNALNKTKQTTLLKKEKKKKKKKRQRQETYLKKEHDEFDDNVVAATSVHDVGVATSDNVETLPMATVPLDAKSFFKQLEQQEAAKEPVGTVHSRGLPAPLSATTITMSDKWECPKAGCGHRNSKHAPACHKCGAMKRLSEWR